MRRRSRCWYCRCCRVPSLALPSPNPLLHCVSPQQQPPSSLSFLNSWTQDPLIIDLPSSELHPALLARLHAAALDEAARLCPAAQVRAAGRLPVCLHLKCLQHSGALPAVRAVCLHGRCWHFTAFWLPACRPGYQIP